jgi:hypothetical protein
VERLQTRFIDHAGVRSPDGRIFDIRGFVSEEEFASEYTSPPYDIREVTSDGLSAFETTQRYAIERARRIAETLWPELPWKDTFASRVVTFADEFEALCRKHKLWIRGPFPTQLPMLSVSEDDEGGYKLRPTVDGFTYTIDRYLVP